MTGPPPHLDVGLGDAERALLQAAFDEGARRAPAVTLSFDTFRARVLDVARREGRAGGSHDAAHADDVAAAYLRHARLDDLYLATACELGDPRAWETLLSAVRAPLEAIATRRVGSAADAEACVQDLLGDLAAPPPRREARTLLGTFDATGSLLGWLSIVLLRRIQARAQRKTAASLDAQPPGIREAATPRRADSAPLAAGDAVESSEAVRIFSAAFDRTWPTLSAQERLVLTLKHRDDWTQRRIAAALAVDEARVSRVASAAVEKLSQAVREVADSFAGDRSDGLRAVFAGIVAERLASWRGDRALRDSGGVRGPHPRAFEEGGEARRRRLPMSAEPVRDEDQVRWFVRHGRGGSSSGACPDENVLVGWAERRLDPTRAEAVDAHLADCDACRDVALLWRETAASRDPVVSPALEDARPAPALRRLSGGRLARWAPFAAAAAILIAVGLRVAGREGGASATGDSRLVAAASRLSRAHPDIFGDFAPVTAAERDAVPDDRSRAAISIREPVGLVLDAPTRASWVAPPDVTEVRVVVLDTKGETVWSATSRERRVTTVEIPARARIEAGGRYVLEVSGDGALASSTLRRSFAVATPEARAAWNRAAETIRAEAPPEICEVLVAHAAVRRGLLGEARRVAAARSDARPDDADASAIRDYAERRLEAGDSGP